MTDLVFSVLKALSFGLIISVVSCYWGLSVRSSMTEVPQMTIKAVVNALFYCIAANLVFSALALMVGGVF